MEILIHDERPDELKLLPDGIVSKVYKTDIREDRTTLVDMASGERYSVVLTNDRYEEVDLDQHSGGNGLKSGSVFSKVFRNIKTLANHRAK